MEHAGHFTRHVFICHNLSINPCTLPFRISVRTDHDDGVAPSPFIPMRCKCNSYYPFAFFIKFLHPRKPVFHGFRYLIFRSIVIISQATVYEANFLEFKRRSRSSISSFQIQIREAYLVVFNILTDEKHRKSPRCSADIQNFYPRLFTVGTRTSTTCTAENQFRRHPFDCVRQFEVQISLLHRKL